MRSGLLIALLISALFGVINAAATSYRNKRNAKNRDFHAEVEDAKHSYKPEPKKPRPVKKPSSQRDFSAPEPACIVCEQTGEDHFVRDKERRLAQLDDWLKIGLIDRDEYRVMRDRYERGI